MPKKLFDDGKQEDEYQLRCGSYPLDEVISALQKEIRRANPKMAVYWLHQLYKYHYWKYAARRLAVIALEDVLDVDLQVLAVEVANLAEKQKTPVDEVILATEVMELAQAKHNREGDNLLNIVLKMGYEEIPDYAKDKHTKAGKELGRGLKTFWEDGALLKNEGGDTTFTDEWYRISGYKKPTEKSEEGGKDE